MSAQPAQISRLWRETALRALQALGARFDAGDFERVFVQFSRNALEDPRRDPAGVDVPGQVVQGVLRLAQNNESFKGPAGLAPPAPVPRPEYVGAGRARSAQGLGSQLELNR